MRTKICYFTIQNLTLNDFYTLMLKKNHYFCATKFENKDVRIHFFLLFYFC